MINIRCYSYSQILENKMNVTFVDVRSEKEYQKEHIPNAINIPLLNDEQYKIVGTVYKKEGQRYANEAAIKLVGPRLLSIYQDFYKLIKPNKQIIVYCARGGKRSQTITSLLEHFAFSIAKLDKGYKGYREYINNNIDDLINEKTFITFYGPTGCGKTNLLKKLSKKGYDVLDLEACANHRGSLLGAIGLKKANSQKQFESLVFENLYNAKSKYIFVEGESKRIGNIVMSNSLYNKIINSKKIYIECSLDKRIENIKKDYLSGQVNYEEIECSLMKLSRYYGKNKIKTYIEKIKNNQSDEVIEDLIINYYDKVYSSKKSDFENCYNNDDEEQCLNNILTSKYM